MKADHFAIYIYHRGGISFCSEVATRKMEPLFPLSLTSLFISMRWNIVFNNFFLYLHIQFINLSRLLKTLLSFNAILCCTLKINQTSILLNLWCTPSLLMRCKLHLLLNTRERACLEAMAETRTTLIAPIYCCSVSAKLRHSKKGNN